jgi:copper chaperone
MKTIKFKTNINCGGCIAAVTPALDGLKEITTWAVDTTNPDKILTVEAATPVEAQKIISTLKEKGYRAEKVD